MTEQQMLSVYRHDAHKMRGQSHTSAPEEWFGVSVNADVPYGADGDASSMSRPNGKPEQVLVGHDTHYRRSLITGDTLYDPEAFSLQQYGTDLQRLLKEESAIQMHQHWLENDVVSGFNESVYYPYTSLKYHTLLVAALVDTHRNGHQYDDLGLWLTPGEVTPHRTIFAFGGNQTVPGFTLDIAPHKRGESAKLSSYPMRNFASVWNRLPAHPWSDTQLGSIRWLDSRLRRIEAWSTALQYLENALAEME